MDYKESNEVCPKEAGSEIVTTSVVDERPLSLGPKTPVTERESKDFSYDCDSPVTVTNVVPKSGSFDDEACRLANSSVSVHTASPRTPEDGVFDPFAPGPESLVWAPICKKYTDGLKVNAARMLRYDSLVENDNLDSVLDREIDSLYKSLLEFILSRHMEETLSTWSDVDESKTPSVPRLRAAADTCPGAPMKRPAEARNINLGLCRKLF